MDPLQSLLLASQAPMPELLEHGFDGDVSSSPLPDLTDGDHWIEEADDATDRQIFAALVGGS